MLRSNKEFRRSRFQESTKKATEDTPPKPLLSTLRSAGMLAADKQLLDAQLRDELQELRVLEITNVVQRFQNALTPATLIAGFCFGSIVELDFSDHHKLSPGISVAEPLFYISAASALSLALYVTAVSSLGIVFGQRLTIQATATQGFEHEATVRELNCKFLSVLIALGVAITFVVIGVCRHLPRPVDAHDVSMCLAAIATAFLQS